MRPLICLQCGGQIDEYAAGADFTVCEYCGTKFLVEANKQPRVVPPPVVDAPALETEPDSPFAKVAATVGLVIIGIVLFGVIAYKPPKGIVAATTTPAT